MFSRLAATAARRGPNLAFPTILLMVFALVALWGSYYIVDTNNVGVEKTLGKVNMQETTAGVNLKMPFLTKRYEFTAKEVALDMDDLRPKALDNLSLDDLDVTIYYRAAPEQIAELMVKYANATKAGRGGLLPAYGIVEREARGAIYEEVSKVDSLNLHRQREQLQSAIENSLQKRLRAKDGDALLVTRVVVRSLNTDRSIEESIRKAVANEKELEAKQIEIDIAIADAKIEIERAKGIAESNEIIDQSLSARYLQHEINEALKMFAENNGQVVVMPANMQGFDLILDTQSLTTQREAKHVEMPADNTG
jgi:regulator of protease activity HflC (stomatin/prohibitin superfamily)